MADERSIVFARLVQKMRPRDLAKSLTKIDKSIQGADRQIEQCDVFFKMLCDSFEGQIMTPRKNHSGLLCFWKDDFLQKETIRFGAIELLRHPAGFADLADFDQVRGFQREDVMTNPCRRLSHRPRELRERGGGSHQQAQNLHAAGIGQKLDIPERMNSLNFLHFN